MKSLPVILALGFVPLLAWGCAESRQSLHAAHVDSVPKPNRQIEMNTVWAKSKPLNVRLRQAGMNDNQVWNATLRAIHDKRAISILAIWPDATESKDRVCWQWDQRKRQYYKVETPCDLFAFKFCISGAPDACMMTGKEGVYDVWEWRAGWSHISGYADDWKLIVTRKRPLIGDFHIYPAGGTGNGPGEMVYIQWQDDKGDLPYEFTPRPMRYGQPVMEGIRARKPSGSAGDVLAEAVYQGGSWALEIWRLLKTGNDDDYSIEGSGPHLFSIALTDGQEGQAHFTSDLIRLYLD